MVSKMWELKGTYKDIMSLLTSTGAALEKLPGAFLDSPNGRATHDIGISISVRENPFPLCVLYAA